MGSNGRMGAQGCVALEALASEAKAYAAERSPGVRLATSWRAALERSLLYAEADVVLQCLGMNLEGHRAAVAPR